MTGPLRTGARGQPDPGRPAPERGSASEVVETAGPGPEAAPSAVEATGAAKRPELVGLTILRGFAALWVVVYHFHFHFGHALDYRVIERGPLAVDTFFILSGFVLAYVYLRSYRARKLDYRTFIVKRVARIYPLHLVTMLAAFAILAGGARMGLSDIDVRQEAVALVPTTLMLHAWGTLSSLRLNAPSWSISAEFFAYLAFPLFAFLLSRTRRPVLGAVALLAALALTAHLLGYSLFWLTTFSVPRIIPEFALGMALFMTLEGRRLRNRGLFWVLLSGAVALIAVLLLFGPDWSFVLAAAALIGLLYCGDDFLSGIRARPLIRLGVISYSIYMVHGLIEMTGFKVIEKAFHYGNDRVPLAFLPLMLVLAVACGALAYSFVESPAQAKVVRLYRKRVGRRRDPAATRSALSE